MDISGKKFLITGASSGIGAATAKYAAKRDAKVILVARSESKLEGVAREIREEGGTASLYVADLSDIEAVREVTARIQDDEGAPDIIMNNAGAGKWKYAGDTTPDEAIDMMMVPYLAAFSVTHAFLPKFIERKSGTIVNMTSAAAYLAWPGATTYIAARCAIRGFNDALRSELNPYGIKVTLVAFAKVTSDYWKNNPGSEQNIPERQSMIPVLSPQDAATHIIAGIERDKEQVIEPWQLRSIITLAKFFPGMVK
uniref:Short-chain dehydrogenase n=1 Tax=Candidatus Kentrum sp. MB TaxID=2138164 RepID=A0A450XSS5_9GAMM|nr:MAG: Short-chain dehydrogenase [Candidatus Kentron sp. MB]VFK33555.1 MAG: Short-chain dehydrogenase [Candidatus Kentron sp. MB]VFK77050.1 MAG: Short-chain dehydrogenase [Candidatus Kentron sp. MB]